MFRLIFFILIACFCITTVYTVASEPTIPETPSDQTTADDQGHVNIPIEPEPGGLIHTDTELTLSLAVLVFGCFALVLTMRYLANHHESDLPTIVKAICMILITTGVLFVVASGTNSDKLAAAFGFFGTMIGYVMGGSRRARSRDNDQHQEPEPDPAAPGIG